MQEKAGRRSTNEQCKQSSSDFLLSTLYYAHQQHIINTVILNELLSCPPPSPMTETPQWDRNVSLSVLNTVVVQSFFYRLNKWGLRVVCKCFSFCFQQTSPYLRNNSTGSREQLDLSNERSLCHPTGCLYCSQRKSSFGRCCITGTNWVALILFWL